MGFMRFKSNIVFIMIINTPLNHVPYDDHVVYWVLFHLFSPDVDVQTPDEKSVITYVSTLYDVFPKVPDGVDGINANVST